MDKSEEYRKGYQAGYQKGKSVAPRLVDISKLPKIEKTCYNLNEDYADVDQFVCSKCGIHLQSWVRIDEDDYDDGIVHEYAFRYCPNCGAKVVETCDECEDSEYPCVAKDCKKCEKGCKRYSKDEPQIKQSDEFKEFIGHECGDCRWSKYGEGCTIPCCDFEPKQTEK